MRSTQLILTPLAHSPYGHRPAENGLLSLLGFNGERPDPLTGHYHLGNGYRQFNPVLMRVNSPDSWSPFGEGGLNAYAFANGDPRNKIDPDGHRGISSLIKAFRNLIKTRTPSRLFKHGRENVENIMKGGEVKYKGKTFIEKLPDSDLPPIDLSNAPKKIIAQHVDFFDQKNSLIYNTSTFSDDPFKGFLPQERYSITDRWRPTYKPSVSKELLMEDLADSVMTHRHIKNKTTPNKNLASAVLIRFPAPVMRKVR